MNPWLEFYHTKPRRMLINPFQFAAAAGGAIALIANVGAGSTNSNTVTTAAIDTTGANALCLHVGYLTFGGDPTISDSKGNTWTALTLGSTSFIRGRLYYCLNATVGSGHTFTATGTGFYQSVTVAAFSNVLTASAFDVENGATGSATTSLQTGSVTPSENDELIVTGFTLYNSTNTLSINSGFTITNQITDDGSNHTGSCFAYLIQTTAGAVNPTWSWTDSRTGIARIATLKKA